ncbi:MAG: hypothetical protein QMD82_04925 [bacterium]|nr:hypothetical protein [bacterium]
MSLNLKKIRGQKKVKQLLKPLIELLRGEKIDSIFLEFYGPEGVGKFTTALEIAKAVNCENYDEFPCGRCPQCIQIGHLQHPDLFLLMPDMNSDKWIEAQRRGDLRTFYNPLKQIKIEEIREVERELWKERPYSGRYRFVIVANGENLNQYAQNAFLKTLEEPYPRTVIIFIVSRPERILPTIHSRARKIKFDYLSFRDFNEYFETIDLKFSPTLLYRITSGSIGKAKRYIATNFIETRSRLLKAISDLDPKNFKEICEAFLNQGVEGGNSEGVIEDIVDFYGSVARDLFLVKSGVCDLIVNVDLKDDIIELSKKIRNDQIQEMMRIYKEASHWLRSNVKEEVIPYALFAPFTGRDFLDVFKSY